MDVSHSRPHKVFDKAPVRPLDVFAKSLSHVVSASPFVDESQKHPRVTVTTGDARKLPYRSSFFDLVITSPPYLNAIDYMRCSKFALIWMGRKILELRETRSSCVGAEVGISDRESMGRLNKLARIPARRNLPDRWRRILDRYIIDMTNVVMEIARVLKPGGRAVFVLGDSRVRGVAVSNSQIVKTIAQEVGLVLDDCERRNLVKRRRYLPPPDEATTRGQLVQRMGYEVILRFTRPTL